MVRINTNLPALLALRQGGDDQSKGSLTMERLATGLRVIRAAHDPAYLGISEKMRSQIRGHNQAIRNVQQGISLLQTAEGGLNETQSLLQSIREMILSALDRAKTSSDRINIQKVISGYLQEIDEIAANTHFTEKFLLDGNPAALASSEKSTTKIYPRDIIFTTAIGRMDSEALGISKINAVNPEKINQSLTLIDQAIEQVFSQRSSLGEMINRLEHSMENLLTASENLTASESLIREADSALESLDLTRYQINLDTSLAMLAQANLEQQNVFRLLFNVSE